MVFVMLILAAKTYGAKPRTSNNATITKYEAEDAVLTGVTIAQSLSGYSGTGYMDGASFDVDGDQITFTVKVAATASYPLIVRFQNTCGACEKSQNISVNGGVKKYVTFLGTSASWQDMNVGDVDLKEGDNTIAISKSWGWMHIDYIGIGENDVTPPTAPENLKPGNVTQTSFRLSWNAATDNEEVAGYNVYFGSVLKSYVTDTFYTVNDLDCRTEYPDISIKAIDKAGNISLASDSISVTTSVCQLYTLTVNNGDGGGSFNSGKILTITADAAPSGKIFDQWIGSDAIRNPTIAITTLVMPEAATEITATYKNIDPTPLLDPAATEETVKLWNYLKSVYGQKMLTGCWTETQFGGNAKVYSCTGEMPAIWGQDMNSWYRDRNEFNWKNTWNANIAGFKNAYKRGQILQVNWHWQMPSSKVDGVYTRDAWGKDASGNTKMMTSQQWADIVTPGTALYDAMIEDIDYHVVNFLKKIVDANGTPIPILFRPMHEIDGGWFWWTCPYDPTKTAKLYQILQDRIMNYHGCHNLIWVFNSAVSCNGGGSPPFQTSELNRRKAFYPGDTHCDITGIDLYDYDPIARGTLNSTGKTYHDAFNLMKTIAPDKMVALCESEGLPDIELSFTDPNYAPWLYCLPWYSINYTDNISGEVRDLCAWNKIQFKSAYAVNAGDFVLTSLELPLDPDIPGINIYPNPSNGYVTVSFQPEFFHFKIKVLLVDISGKMVYNAEASAADRLRISTGNLLKGVYILRVISDKNDFSGKLIIN
jgi:hypothetical protein